jgi:protein TonB
VAWVEVKFAIASNGSVIDALVVRASHPGQFDAEALEAVRRWRYNPAARDGKPVHKTDALVRLVFDVTESEWHLSCGAPVRTPSGDPSL